MFLALFRASHPGPTVAVTAIAAALSVGANLEAWRIIAITLMVLFNQLSVGLSNDWLDSARDHANARKDKPLARGELSVAAVRRSAIAFAITSIILSLTLGPLSALANGALLASGWLYNVGLKATLYSVLPYVVGFGALPLIATFAAAPPLVAPVWMIAAGSLLGVAAHFSNVLPDLEEDRKTGIRGLPHAVGAPVSAAIIATSLIAAALAIVFGPGTPLTVLSFLALGLAVSLACVSVIFIVRGQLKRVLFQLTIVVALSNVLLLVTAPGIGY